jgi:TetR/AcrR family transcriptional repressor of nem operon
MRLLDRRERKGSHLALDKKYDDRNIIAIMSTVLTKKELSHARIVDVAARAIRRAGYHGVGVADIKGATRFSALVETYLHDTHIGKTEDGCIVAAMASEMTRQEDAVRDEARRRVAAMVELVQSALPADATAGEAQLVTATMVGALQLARTVDGKAGRDLLAKTRKELIARHDRINHR